MMITKETNSFYVEEQNDTRLKFSIGVPDEKGSMEEFKPKESFDFQENFRKTLDLNKSMQVENTKCMINEEISKEKVKRLVQKIK